jgi:hypothetical protein
MPRLAGRAIGVALVFPASSALAHARAAGGAWIAPQGWFEPWVLACLALALGLYGIGLARLWRRSGTGRGARAGAAAAFAAGWLVVALALVGPLERACFLRLTGVALGSR